MRPAKVLILGASGVIGQHLRRWQVSGPTVLYHSRSELPWGPSIAVDFTDAPQLRGHLDMLGPDVIVNLLGENRPDVVEANSKQYEFINVDAPLTMKNWCEQHSAWLIHISSQAVFDGEMAPYSTNVFYGMNDPVNRYGRQKRLTEQLMLLRESPVIVVRLTFVLGVRPFPTIGRANPAESFYAMADANQHSTQVADRYFSVAFANDAAFFLWQLIGSVSSPLDPLLERFLRRKRVFNLGLPVRWHRAELARALQVNLWKSKLRQGEELNMPNLIKPVKHDTAFPYPKWAKRPIDTTYGVDAIHDSRWEDALMTLTADWRRRMDPKSEVDRALEIAMFLGLSEGEARVQLMRGFGPLHADVAKDFIEAKVHVGHEKWDDFQLLQWYKQTNSYIWELTAYHLDAGFNYSGMCQGIVAHLTAEQVKGTVLVLGDGIGDLTMALKDAGHHAIYHDLLGSQTARFASFRFTRKYPTAQQPTRWLSEGWAPPVPSPQIPPLTAILALDFFEHMPNVEEYVTWCFKQLVPGGLFLAQNGFAMGDDEHGGSIPMHLSRNNVYADPDPQTGEAGWDVLLRKVGFINLNNGWRQKPV